METALRDLAERQHGVLSRPQIIDRATSARTIDAMLRRGELVNIVNGIYRVAGAPRTWEQRVMAAWLSAHGPGHTAVIARTTAAALHGIHGYPSAGKPSLTITRGGSRRSPIAVIATCSDLHATDVITMRPSGVLVTAKTRTVFDLALGMQTTARLDRLIDRSLHDKHTTVPQLWEVLLRTSASGKRGVVRLRDALTIRSDDYVPLTSELEHLADEALVAWGLPQPDRQHPLPGAPFGFVDRAYGDARLVVELDGRQHQLPMSRRVDYERDIAAARVGWQVIRFDWHHVKFQPEWFAQSVADVRRSRLELFAGARSSLALSRFM